MRRPYASPVLLGAWAALVGCGSTTDTSTTTTTTDTTVNTPVATTVTVLPKSFLGAVPCSNNPGAMRTYVATLTDTTQSAHPFILPSSPPTPCSQAIAFEYVIAGHEYTAAIDAYTLTVPELQPLGGLSSGSRTMLWKNPRAALAQRDVIAPVRWTTTCGAVFAGIDVDVPITDCDPLYDYPSNATTGIKVGIVGSLGLLACTGSPSGTVDRFDVSPGDPSLPKILGATCDAQVSYTTGLKEGALYTFSVAAYNKAGGLPAYSTTCSATATKGLIVVAACAPLAPTI